MTIEKEILSKDGTFVAFKSKPELLKTSEKCIEQLIKEAKQNYIKIKHPDGGYLTCLTCGDTMYECYRTYGYPCAWVICLVCKDVWAVNTHLEVEKDVE